MAVMTRTLSPFVYCLLTIFLLHAHSSAVAVTATATVTRRLLHQPFLPLDSLPPSESPLPSPGASANPKYPFSVTAPPAPPVDYPFFPTVASSPPPPSPATFASFPANISSLIVPHSESSKRGSNKLVALSIAAVVSALAVLAVAVLFFYYKRRRSRSGFADDKTLRSESSSRFLPPVGNNAERSTSRAQKLRTGSASGGASSEFLYLGTLVDSRRAEGGTNSSSRNGRFDPRKMDSPELHPLPPLLARRSINDGSDVGNGTEMTSTVDEEEEEFYSPKGSIGTGSGSRRVFAAVEEVESRSSSSSSSASSPGRSQSISYSPPVSFSPKRQEANISVPRRPPPPPPPHPPPPPPPPPPPQQAHFDVSSSASSPNSYSPERGVLKSSALMDHVQNVRSPSLSPISSSPERAPIAVDSKLRSSSSLSSSSSSTPERISEMKSLIPTLDKQSRSPTLSASSSTKESPARASDASAKKWQIVSPERDLDNHSVETSSVSNDSVELTFEFDPHRLSLESSRPSPERVLEKNQESPPRVSDATEPDRKRHSPSLSLSSSSSLSPARLSNASDWKSQIQLPERVSAEPKEASLVGIPTKSDLKSRSLSPSPPSSSPEKDLHKISNGFGDSGSRPDPPILVSEPSLTIPKPPPLPKPQWEAHPPTLATPVYRPPPALLPPSRPFVLQAPADLTVSPMELPPPPSSTSPEASADEDAPKPKLKPLHWDKVRASSDREMVWDQLRSSSFKLNEEMIETLFVVKTPTPKPKELTPRSALPSPITENRVLDPKKSQNIAISLRALNVTIEEVCEALMEGTADALGNELLESLMKMAPTKEEERKLKEYKDDSPVKLGPAEKFLKAVLDVPFAFKRVEAMLYVANLDSEVDYLKKSFETLEGACEELRNSRMFMKLLEAVLKTGNRMNVGTNRGDAQAFKLDTLLKLIDIKGADGKTTLLHFVVQEIIRTEGARSAGPTDGADDDTRCRRLGLQVVSSLGSELASVKRAATMDSDVLAGEVSRLSKGVVEIREVVSRVGPGRFSESMEAVARRAEEEIIRIQAQESVALSLVKEITEYFHGNSAKEEAHPFRIFMVVRDFLSVLDRVCKEVGMINERTTVSSAHKFPVPVNPMLAQGLPVPKKPYISSDEECSTP